MRFYIIAGERSGDLHGSNLVKELSARYELADFRGVGGKRMQKENVVIAKPSSELSFMGFWEVIKHLRKIAGVFRFIKKDIRQFRPDVLILIDFPGFNLRLAKWARKKGFKVVYYITPQVWAWKSDRVYKLDKRTDKMITILPFEQQFFKNYNIGVESVSHPIAVEIEAQKALPPDPQTEAISSKPIIALLPGSRKQEIRHILPTMSAVAKFFPDYQFVVAGVSEIKRDYYEKFISTDWVKIVYDKTYDLLKMSRAALVTSGTATLETALFNVPQVVCYKGNKFSYWMARRMVEIDFISLVNLVLKKQLVTELIQDDLTDTNFKDELEKILPDGRKREEMLNGYLEMTKKLGTGSGSEQAAEIIFELMKE
ncbi:MAG: lipid-A-disaccharide synthase [Bacteroidetes bacterium]|nr:lipid-A-disaccharide synthase [Bacteroidota bacterium]